MDVELLKQRLKSFLVTWNDRRVTKGATSGGSECTRKAMEVSAKNEAEGQFSSVDKEVSRNQESTGTVGITSVGDDHDSGMEGEFVVCEHVEK